MPGPVLIALGTIAARQVAKRVIKKSIKQAKIKQSGKESFTNTQIAKTNLQQSNNPLSAGINVATFALTARQDAQNAVLAKFGELVLKEPALKKLPNILSMNKKESALNALDICKDIALNHTDDLKQVFKSIVQKGLDKVQTKANQIKLYNQDKT